MAEEITYIPYGLNEISQLDLMTNLANGLPSFMQQYKWLLKPKNQEKFLKAYDDITKNLTGATDSSGRWIINVNNIDIDGMSPKDKEIYEHAAYYIQLQMSLMTPRAKEEEKKNENLDKFDFIKSFNQLLLNNYYGGNLTLFADSEQGWNALDARGSNGLRGTDKRRERMIEALESYKKGLEGKNFNFEGTSFTDINDAYNKILAAIDALKTSGEEDDLKAFSALGLPYRSYFSNGGNDASGYLDAEGNSLTWQQYNEYQNKLNEAKAKAEAEASKLKLAQLISNQYKRFRFHKGTGVSAEYLSKYGDNVLGQLSGYGTNGQQLTQELKNELVGAFQIAAKNGQLENLSKEELSKFGKGYANSPQRLKKIKGLEGFYWDTIGNRVIQPFMETTTPLTFLDIINANSPQAKLQLYLNSKIPGITNAEWKELSAIGLDIASIINPEAITGSGMALGAAALRHSAKNDSNPNWSFGDYIWQGVDYLTGALGGILVLGDLTLSAKTMATASKALPILRKIARAGAWTDLYLSYPDLKEATRKITSGEELTVKDWRAIGQGIRGLVSHGRLNRGNRAERRVLEKSGQNITPENISSLRGKVLNYSLKLGFTRTKPTNTSEISTVKATVNGKESEIEISSNAKARIQEKVLKAGNNTEARNKAVKEVLESEGKVKASDKIEVEAPTYRDGKYAPGWLGTSRNLFGTKQISSKLGNDIFNNYISGNRSYWDRYKYGSNTELKGIYNRLNINNPTSKSSIKKTETTETKSNDLKALPFHTNKKVDIERIRKYQENFKKGNGADSSEDLNFNIDEVTGSVNLGRGNSLNYFKLDDGKYRAVWVIGGKQYSKNFNSVKELKERMAKLANDLSLGLYGKINHKEVAQALRNMEAFKLIKANKYGGTLNNPYIDTIIEDFINNNNI